MRTDPLKRFVVKGDGNALRVTLNSDQQRHSVNKEDASRMIYDPSHSNAAMSNFAHFQRERRYEQERHEPSRMICGHSVLQGPGPQYPPIPPSALCMGPYQGPDSSENINIGHYHMRDDPVEHQHIHGRLNSNNGPYSMGMQTGRTIPEQFRVFDRSFIAHSSSPKNIKNQMKYIVNPNVATNTANNVNENVHHHNLNEQRVRADHQMQVQQSYLRSQGLFRPSHQKSEQKTRSNSSSIYKSSSRQLSEYESELK